MKTLFGKKQILLAGLIIALGAAVYLNYHFTTNSPLSKETGNTVKTTQTSKNLGDSVFVNNNNTTTPPAQEADYFAQVRENRKNAREEALEIIEEVSSDVTISEETLKEVLNKASELAMAVEQEVSIEGLILAKDFEECVVFIEGDKCSVVVRAESLTPDQVMQITDIIISQSKVPAHNVNIVPVKK